MADATLREEIEKIDAKFVSLFNKQDAVGIAELYSVDSKIMPNGMDVQKGRNGVAKVYQNMFDAGGATIKVTIDESDDSVLFDGKYVVLWKKVEGQWYIYNDIINFNK
ncbi:hypothetical protein EMCRGX_G001150 [Ephydatia muelleri]